MSDIATDVVDNQTTETTDNKVLEKHLLPHRWCLWVTCSTRTGGKSKAIKRFSSPVFEFETIEEFWAIYNSLLKPQQMPKERCNVMIMRCKENGERVRPEWEDPENVNGGEFVAELPTAQADKQWELTLLSLIGGSFPHSDDITGVWLIIRHTGINNISLWHKTASDDKIVQEIGDAWQQFLSEYDLKPVTCKYITHKENLRAASSKGTPVPSKTWNDSDSH